MDNKGSANQKINAKDLINVGIFTAIYFLSFFVVGMLGYVPILMILLPLLLPVVCGIPFMLYLTKVNKFGMVTLMGVIVAILMFATGHGWPVLVFATLFPLLADLIFKAGQYKSWKKTVFGYAVFTQWAIGAMIPMWIMRESYFAMVREGYGEQYADQLMAIMSNWMLPVLSVLAVIGAIIGAYIGRAALRKHFQRAGIV